MLTLYLAPKTRPLYIPSDERIRAWVSTLLSAEFAREISPLTLVPSVGVGQLFNQDAHEALLPAELSFEQLTIERAPSLTFLPLEQVDLEVSCRGCGDPIDLDDFDRALKRLQLVDTLQLSCESCQRILTYKELTFDTEVAMTRFWISLEGCGSARLNPILLKSWGDQLGCTFKVVIEHREEWLDWEGGTQETWAGGEGVTEWGIKPSRSRSRKSRSAQGKLRSRSKRPQGRSGPSGRSGRSKYEL